MSLFPRRAAPGQTVTIHLRHLLLLDGAPGLNYITLQVFAPNGERMHHEHRELLSFLPAMVDEEGTASELGTRFAYSPLLLSFRRGEDDHGPVSSEPEQALFALIHRGREAGHLDAQQAERMEVLLRSLIEGYAPPPATRRLALDMAVMRASSHIYWHLSLPRDAAPGEYLVLIAGPGSMGSEVAPVLHRETLLVDRPRLLEVGVEGDRLRARVANEANVAVPVRLAQPRGRGAKTSLHELAPRSVTSFELDDHEGPGFLLFAEGTRALTISRSSAPLLVRCGGVVMSRDGDDALCLRLPPTGAGGPSPMRLFPDLEALAAPVRRELDVGTLRLDGPMARALLLADGLHQVDAIERRCGPEAVAAIEAQGLARRVELATVAGEDPTS